MEYGGTSVSVPTLCNELVALGVDNHLVTSCPADATLLCNYPLDRSRVHLAAESVYLRQWGAGSQFRRLLERLCSDAKSCIVHDHAVWLPSNHAIASFCARNGLKRIVSPRGMLGAWAMANGALKKRLAWWLYQRRDLQNATAFHATSDQEADEIRSLGFEQPIVVVPNGVSLPATLPDRKSNRKQFLFMSRIHPKKGVLELLRAWKESDAIKNGWHLVIAGPDDGGHRLQVEKYVCDQQISSSVNVVGEVRGDAKWQILVDSDFFILPSFNENFGIAIAEALACGVPAITTTSTPWSIIEEKQLGWWIPCEHLALVSAINEANQCPESVRLEKSRRAQTEIATRFSWQKSARDLSVFYESLI